MIRVVVNSDCGTDFSLYFRNWFVRTKNQYNLDLSLSILVVVDLAVVEIVEVDMEGAVS